MILHFDFSTGASGDKILGALIELCESLGVARFEDVQTLGQALVPGACIGRTQITSGGVRATGLTVVEQNAPVRHWREIREQIEQAKSKGLLSARASALALKAFGAIAQAEATVHGCDIEQVHFHEVGAADSIIDICCSSFIFEKIGAESVFASPLALGSGTFVCSHGELPIPAPATARLIEGLPVYAGAHEGELTTPTGAALARCFVNAWEPLPCIQAQAIGYGGGTRIIAGAANVVRVLAGERLSLAETYGELGCSGIPKAALPKESVAREPVPRYSTEGCVLLETNIDHLSPEALAFACEELLKRGALDVWQEPVTMKKGRLAVRLCVLSSAASAQVFAAAIIELTGSLGVRRTYVERTVAAREIVQRKTPYGSLAYKTALVATPCGSVKLQRPEYEDVARIAREQGLDFNALYAELQQGQLPESENFESFESLGNLGG